GANRARRTALLTSRRRNERLITSTAMMDWSLHAATDEPIARPGLPDFHGACLSGRSVLHSRQEAALFRSAGGATGHGFFAPRGLRRGRGPGSARRQRRSLWL